MNYRKKKNILIALVILPIVLTSCESNALLSVNHFQDAKTLECGETKVAISYEEALSFHFIAKKQETNNFGERPFIVTPNVQCGIGKRFEVGVQLLPISRASSGGNIYLKYSNGLNPWLSYGIVFIGGYVDVNNNDAASLLTLRVDDIATEYYSYKKTIITDFHIEMPFTITSKYVSFTIGPYIGNYHVDEHYIYTADYGLWQKYGTRDIDNHDIINYMVPGVSLGVSIQLPLESYIVMELSTLRIGHTILSYDGIGFGIRKSLF